MKILCLLICGLIGYLIGAIPFALVISKLFFHIDVRDYGSHNAGGTNAGRVMGLKVGFIVIVLDACKIALIFLINLLIITKIFGFDKADIIYTYIQEFSAFCAVIGHSYPIYFNFKGGKAVSCTTGTIFFTNFICFPIGVIVFFITLFKTKYVSLSSILGSFVATAVSFFHFSQYGMWFGMQYDIVYPLTLTMIFLVLLVRHKENIVRLKNKCERKIKWLK